MQVLHTVVLFGLLALVPAGWLLPERYQVRAVAVLTAALLLAVAPLSAGLLLLTAGLSYGLFRLPGLRPGGAALLAVGQAVAVWMLFKSELGARTGWWAQAGVPLGLSYYVFRQIHYALERYKQTLPAHTWADYLRYLFFLPTLLGGPINRFPDFLRDARRRRWDAALFSAGLERILYGYAKIVVLGNALFTQKLGHLIDGLAPTHPALGTYLGILRFVLNAYVQFAGYSDVAIGLGLLLGFRLPENFNSPFLAASLGEFWRRYHMTLSAWCRDYVFTPVLSLTRRAGLAVLASMLVLGLWHEWSGRFLVWGALQGLGVLAWRRFEQARASRGPAPPLLAGLSYAGGVLLTLHYYALSCVVISHDTWGEVLRTFQRLLSLS